MNLLFLKTILPVKGGFGSVRFLATHDPTPSWPSSRNPTPYEVMNLTPADFSHKNLKRNYLRFAKIYHPDLSHASTVHHRGTLLTQAQKNERFREVTSAYHLLRDKKKRRAYDNYAVGWNSVSASLSPTAATRASAPAYAPAYDGRYWNAGTWDDARNAYTKPVDPKERQAENVKLLYLLLAAVAVTAFGQYVLAERDTERALLLAWELEKIARSDLRQARGNYGYGLEQDERIHRFLGHRRYNNVGNQPLALKEAEEADLKVLRELEV